MSIKNIGIDIVKNKRAIDKQRFIQRVLSADEISHLAKLKNKCVRREFIAGRWAAKEAIFKATQIKISFSEINIAVEEKGLVVHNELLKDIKISISHEKNYTIAIAIV